MAQKPFDVPRTLGFTVIEILTVVAVLGLLATVAYVKYSEYINRSKTAEGPIMLKQIANKEVEHFMLPPKIQFVNSQGPCYANFLFMAAAAPAGSRKRPVRGALFGGGVNDAAVFVGFGEWKDLYMSYTISLGSPVFGGANEIPALSHQGPGLCSFYQVQTWGTPMVSTTLAPNTFPAVTISATYNLDDDWWYGRMAIQLGSGVTSFTPLAGGLINDGKD